MIWLLILLAYDFSVFSSAGIYYDNNIFKFSAQETDEFRSGVYPWKFPVKSADDLKAEFSSLFTFEHGLFKPGPTTFEMLLRSSSYLENKVKDYWRLRLVLKQNFRSTEISLGYSLIPTYLIRYYKPVSGTSYIPCEFSRNLFLARIAFSSRFGRFSLDMSYWKDNYSKEFDYYDSNNEAVSIRWRKAFSSYIRPEVSYELSNSEARGPAPDISYFQHSFDISNVFRPGVWRISQISTKYSLDYRLYKSEVSPILDPLHSGRTELVHNLGAVARFRLYRGFYSEVSVLREFRTVSSKTYSDIGKLKNYSRWILGMVFSFRI